MYEPSAIAGLVVTAVLTAGLYALMSYGLALIYGVMRLINLSHAGTMMFGAFITLTLNRAFKLDPLLGSLVVLLTLAVSFSGLVCDRGGSQPAPDKGKPGAPQQPPEKRPSEPQP